MSHQSNNEYHPGEDPPQSGATVQAADPGLRRLVLGAGLLLAMLGLVGVWLLQRHLAGLDQLIQDSPREGARAFLATSRWLFTLMAAGIVLSAGYLARNSWQVLASGRFPAPGQRTIRDTAVLRGNRARTKGRVGLCLAIVLAATGLVVPIYAQHTVRQTVEQLVQKAEQIPVELRYE